jgi:hypothetical protein
MRWPRINGPPATKTCEFAGANLCGGGTNRPHECYAGRTTGGGGRRAADGEGGRRGGAVGRRGRRGAAAAGRGDGERRGAGMAVGRALCAAGDGGSSRQRGGRQTHLGTKADPLVVAVTPVGVADQEAVRRPINLNDLGLTPLVDRVHRVNNLYSQPRTHNVRLMIWPRAHNVRRYTGRR